MSRNSPFRNRIREWIRRYLLADVLSTALSMATAWVIHRTTGDNVLAAFLGAAMASISFYGIIAYNDVRKRLIHHRKHALSYNFITYVKDLRNLIIEFGPSEILDVLAVRPFFMYLMPRLMGQFMLGTFVGKMLADFVFFIPAIVMYEIRKKHLSD